MSEIISSDMNLSDVVQKYPETIKVFHKYNLHCLGCILAAGESLGDGLRAHGLDVETVVSEMNNVISEQGVKSNQ